MDLEPLESLPIEDVAYRLGLNVQRHRALCPFHDDHHPSLMFFPRKNSWKCFVCNKWGGGIKLVMEKMGLDFGDACRWLAVEFGINPDMSIDDVLRKVKVPTVKHTVKREKAAIHPDIEVLTTIASAAGLGREAREFLFEERQYLPAVIRKLKIGSINDEERFVNFLLKHFDEERLLKAGMVFRNGKKLVSYFHAPCLIFPYYDLDGKLQNLQTRYLGDPETAPRFQFPIGSGTHIFNLPILLEKSDEPLYISEGVTDCIALLSAGHQAIAIASATSLKPRELSILAGRKLRMFPDQDAPGEALFNQLQEAMKKYGTAIERMELPEGFKDFSEFYMRSRRG